MINNKTDGITVVHGNTMISPIGPTDNEDKSSGPITFRKCYINYLGFDVTVAERNGLRQRVKRNYDSNYKRDFVIKTYYYIRPDAYEDLEKLFSSFDENSDNDLKQIKEVFYMNFSNKRVGGMTIIISNIISASEFKQGGGTVYYGLQDIVISSLSLLECPAHPFNSSTIPSTNFKDIIDDDESIGFNFELIDNSEKYGVRYINIANHVYQLTPKKDIVKKDGIYVTTLERNLSVKVGKVPVQKRYDIDKCEDTIGVYKTREECIAGGDVKTRRKEELTILEHNFSLEKINLERENNELKQINLKLEKESKERVSELNKMEQERKEEFAKLKHENDLKELKLKQETADLDRTYKMETDALNYKNKLLEADLERQRANTKDYYDNRSHSRKDTSEIVKWLPTIITGILGIVGIVFMKTKMAG